MAMSILQDIQTRAAALQRHIVLPEGDDPRTVAAARLIRDGNIARFTLLGNEARILELAAGEELQLSTREVIDPGRSEWSDEFAHMLFNRRRNKGMTLEQAQELVQDPLYFGALMVATDRADGGVAGAVNTTPAVIRAGLYCLGMKEGLDVVSSSFLMVLPDGRGFTYSDCGVVPDPDAAQLPSICRAACDTHIALTQTEPRAAFLSFSTHGSADHPLVDKMRDAVRLTRKRFPELTIDGELQFDAAVVPAIARSKAPDGILQGQANVFIFPDLNAGNIAYKITQRLAGADALGPLIQGLRKPFLDLSRGAVPQDIMNVTAIAALLGE
jgi:phosphate acetyltransferase